jgi:hypothetical protein
MHGLLRLVTRNLVLLALNVPLIFGLNLHLLGDLTIVDSGNPCRATS